jgi:hypothetical protein
MNNERYNQIIDEVYENYLKNFTPKQCPPNIDVQPRYYEPMTKEWFILSLKEKNDRGREFSKRWGLKIEEKELSLEERMQIWNERTKGFYIMLIWGHGKTQEESLSEHNISTKLITLTYQNESIQFYE